MHDAQQNPSQALSKEAQLLDLLNGVLSHLKPVSYREFNRFLPAFKSDDLVSMEKLDPRLGIREKPKWLCSSLMKGKKSSYGISTLTLLATITDVLVGKRLACIVDRGFITGFTWYAPDSDESTVTGPND
jgi:hypothetical protein